MSSRSDLSAPRRLPGRRQPRPARASPRPRGGSPQSCASPSATRSPRSGCHRRRPSRPTPAPPSRRASTCVNVSANARSRRARNRAIVARSGVGLCRSPGTPRLPGSGARSAARCAHRSLTGTEAVRPSSPGRARPDPPVSRYSPWNADRSICSTASSTHHTRCAAGSQSRRLGGNNSPCSRSHPTSPQRRNLLRERRPDARGPFADLPVASSPRASLTPAPRSSCPVSRCSRRSAEAHTPLHRLAAAASSSGKRHSRTDGSTSREQTPPLPATPRIPWA